MEKGQKVWIRYIGSNPLSHKDELEPFETTIKSIGKIYFKVETYKCGQIGIKTLKEKYKNESAHQVYLSLQDYFDERELKSNIAVIMQKIPEITLEASRHILKMI